MSNKYVFLDFEYNRTNDPLVNLVCVSFKDSEIGAGNAWLNHGALKPTKQLFQQYNEAGYIFVSYNVEAEARAFLSLGLDPTKFKWIDLFLEYRCLLNHNHKLAYGKQLIGGRLKTTRPPAANKWKLTEEEKRNQDMSKPEYNLAAACYKLLGVKIDTDFKNATRDLIISGEFTEDDISQIMEYCESDIKYLPKLLKAIVKNYRELLSDHPAQLKTLLKEMHLRADYSARTAIMVSKGYPIDVVKTKAFSARVPDILWELQSEINSLFPEITPFEMDKKKYFVWKQKKTRQWIEEQGLSKRWIKTKTKQLSLSLEAFRRHFDFKHNYPKDNLGAQFVRFLVLRQNLNGFLPRKPGAKRKGFWDYFGSDSRVRPYFNIYGAQSSRSQPAATGFIPLKSAWMRSLISPPPGKAVCGMDYGQQEFLIAALMSKDKNMIKAYHSGDPYFYFAKLAGAVPMDGERKDYEEIRDMFKSTTLGLSYSMTEIGLAKKLSNDLGKKVTEDDAKVLIRQFNLAFPTYYRFKKQMIREYRIKGHLKLPCGWYMWGDNKNDRSVGNCPVQGFGASVMRKAVQLAQDAGLDVIFTLHDAIYIEFEMDRANSSMKKLAKCMDGAFTYFFKGTPVEKYAKIKLDGNCWGPDFQDKTFTWPLTKEIEMKTQQIYVDGRATEEYLQFKKYMEPIDYELLDI